MKRRRVLFITSHRPGRAPNQRFRFEQYLGYLEANGFDCEVSHIIREEDDKVLYRPGGYLRKALLQWRSLQIRRRDVGRAAEFDIVFIVREALLTGSIHFERRFRAAGPKIVYDFDDAIWHLDVSAANAALGWLKNPGKTAEIIRLSDLVFAGNAYLAAYARRFNPRVVVVPTTIDTDEYVRPPRTRGDVVTIGWSGSITTIKHFEYSLPFLRVLKEKYGDRIAIKVIGDERYVHEPLGIRGQPWRREDEVRDLSELDIGIMPLPDDEWAQGKCGLKGLQYMALGIPTVMSPVGVNTEIIQDARNGFLASSTPEWVEKVSRLVESRELRETLGRAARRTVEERYSVKATRDSYLRHLSSLVE